MRLLLVPFLALLAAVAPAQGLRIDDVDKVIAWRGDTLVLHHDAQGVILRRVLAPITAFTFEAPNTLVLSFTGGELIAPVVYTAVYTSTSGIRIIVQTPCARYSSLAACAKAHADAINEMSEFFPIDITSSRDDVTIVIPRIGK
ncbi:MAG: hypothetical protein V3R87_02795 [Dehalococcoidia bacterium]